MKLSGQAFVDAFLDDAKKQGLHKRCSPLFADSVLYLIVILLGVIAVALAQEPTFRNKEKSYGTTTAANAAQISRR